MKHAVDPTRILLLSESALKQDTRGPVIYWMDRDQRVRDNWALLEAQSLALKSKQPLAVVFVADRGISMTARQADFMLKGLEEVEHDLDKLSIPFYFLRGTPAKTISDFVETHRVAAVVTDFSPLSGARHRREELAAALSVPFFETDAHNVVPCRVASGKLEYAAYTIRPKINRLLPQYLTEYPPLRKHPHAWVERPRATDWKVARSSITIDESVKPVSWIKPGEAAALDAMRLFLSERLEGYAERRNDPTVDFQSGLSPWLHFGQISAQRVALEAQKYDEHVAAQEAFLEELIVRRELSDNFCFYQPHYDSTDGFPAWAAKTLEEHRWDERKYLYTVAELEQAATHDDLWNAAQAEMVVTGKMHGYLRMYWAKKILEWTRGPEEAFEAAVRLNDRYSLDGNDPNGYVGVAWSIGGVHDRAWFEREIFGKIRFMSYDGCRRKFKVDQYIDRIRALTGGVLR